MVVAKKIKAAEKTFTHGRNKKKLRLFKKEEGQKRRTNFLTGKFFSFGFRGHVGIFVGLCIPKRVSRNLFFPETEKKIGVEFQAGAKNEKHL